MGAGRDRAKGKAVPAATTAADRGYDDGEKGYLLETERLHSAKTLNRCPREEGCRQAGGIHLKKAAQHQAGKSQRYKIERSCEEDKGEPRPEWRRTVAHTYDSHLRDGDRPESEADGEATDRSECQRMGHSDSPETRANASLEVQRA